jgi:hypothetical protein
MKRLLFPLLLCLLFSQPLFAQDVNAGWEKWAYMPGEWKGEGSGQPGTGAGTFTLKTKLGGSILERKGKAGKLVES